MIDDRTSPAPIPLEWPSNPIGRMMTSTIVAMLKRGLPGWHCKNPPCLAFNGAAKEWLTHCRCCGEPGGTDP